MQVQQAILQRRSIRRFLKKDIADAVVRKVLEAGRWAPSGLNNQPWRFLVVRDTHVKEGLSGLTHYSHIIKTSPVLLCIFLNHAASYDRDKDLMAIGACVQNMLLQVSVLGLGGCWMGEILKNKEKARDFLGVDPENELMAVVCLGYPAGRRPTGERKELRKLVLKTPD